MLLRDPATFAPARRRLTGAVIVLAVVWAISFNTAVAFFPTVLIGGVLSGLAGWWVRRALPDAARPAWRLTPGLVALGAGVGIVHLGVGNLLFAIGSLIVPTITAEAAAIYTRTDQVPLVWRLVLAGAVTAPLEELFWRGGVQPTITLPLRGHTWIVRAVAAAGVYALFHVATGQVALVAAAALGGLVWSILLERTGSLGACVVAHATWTSLMLVIPPV